jgi:nucleoid DNA-binding protein
MMKVDFTRDISQALDISLKDAKAVLEAILDSMTEALQRGDYIELRGFGTLSTHTRRARQGRNPKTGVVVSVDQKRVPKFKPSRELLAVVNHVPKRVSAGSTMEQAAGTFLTR